MADVTEPIRIAKAKLKELLARMLVRKNEAKAALDKEVARLNEASPEETPLIEEHVAVLREALAQAEHDFDSTVKEMEGLDKFGKDAERDALRAAIHVAKPGDPLSTSAEDQALARVREHIGHLESQKKLNDELANVPPPSPHEPPEDPEARAMRMLAEMKAAKKKT